MVEPEFLTRDDVLMLHQMEIDRRGGRPGVRDFGMLESAVEMPRAGFGQAYLHADLHEMAAAYLFHIVMNHAFIDGNKRTGWRATFAFLYMNGFEIVMDADAAYELVIGVCEGTVTKKQLASALREGSEAR